MKENDERDEREEREMKQPSNIHLYLASQFKKQSKLPVFYAGKI